MAVDVRYERTSNGLKNDLYEGNQQKEMLYYESLQQCVKLIAMILLRVRGITMSFHQTT